MYVGVWIWGLPGVCAVIIIVLCVKIRLMQKAAEEMREGISLRLMTDTNTLIDIASKDKAMCALAKSLNEELRMMRSQRQIYYQGNLALKEAVSNISHDIRTPLTAIQGYLELLRSEEGTENIKRYLNIISERTEVLSRLTEELFRYTIAVSTIEDNCARDEQGRKTAEIGKEDVADLGGLLEESVLTSYGALVQKGIEPDIKLPKEKVRCKIKDKIIRRIFENILNNALKYSDGDLLVTLNERGEVIFANHASSLDAVQIGRLFDRFYTVESARTATGLGLAIVKQLMEEMNGSIKAWYEDGMLYLKLSFPLAED